MPAQYACTRQCEPAKIKICVLYFPAELEIGRGKSSSTIPNRAYLAVRVDYVESVQLAHAVGHIRGSLENRGIAEPPTVCCRNRRCITQAWTLLQQPLPPLPLHEEAEAAQVAVLLHDLDLEPSNGRPG